jgi:hypothetical protein
MSAVDASSPHISPKRNEAALSITSSSFWQDVNATAMAAMMNRCLFMM